MRSTPWLLLAAMLFPLVPGPRERAQPSKRCAQEDALVNVIVASHSADYSPWLVSVCPSGRFVVDMGDQSTQGLIGRDGMLALQDLLSRLPEQDADFGVHHVDRPMLGLTVRHPGISRRYVVGDDVSTEQGNAAFASVAAVAMFVEGLVPHPGALPLGQWLGKR